MNPGPARKRVLIVEDDPALARGLRDNLAFEQIEAHIEASGEEAWASLRTRSFDLVLLDLMLPGISGFELLRRLEKPRRRPHVIIISARDAEADIVRALDLGASDYVRKPFGLGELLARVRAHLREGGEEGACGRFDLPDEVTFADLRVSLRRFRLWKGQVRAPALAHRGRDAQALRDAS